MDRSGTDTIPDEPNRDPPSVEDDATDSGGTRDISLPVPSCATSRWATLTSFFFVGLVSGAVGGLLLGGAAVLVLQSLELLAEKKELMDLLEKYLTQDYYLKKYATLLQDDNSVAHNIHISIFAEIFGILTSSVPLPVGVFIGLSTYALVIKVKGEAAVGKALAVAGSVCLTVVTATGCILGLTLEPFLSIALNINLPLWFFISVLPFLFTPITEKWCKSRYNLFPIVLCFFIPGAAFISFLTSFVCKIRQILFIVLIPAILAANSTFHKLITLTVPLMLSIYDIYHIAGWPVITVQSPASTNTSCVLEAIFVGVLTSLWWSVAVGMLLFSQYWQSHGAGRIYVTAAALGSAVLTVIKLALPKLGPGPTIGSLMGVAAAVGVSLSAAGAAADQYGQAVGDYGFVGRLGVTVGAAAGAFLSSCTHSGLSGMFMALCTAVIPAGEFLKPKFLQTTPGIVIIFLWVLIYFVLSLLIQTNFFSSVVQAQNISNISEGGGH